MGFSIDQLFGDVKKIAEEGMGDLLKQGGAAGLGWLEGKAIDILEKDKNQHEQFVKGKIEEQMKTPGQPGSFGSYFSDLAAQPAIKMYGPYVLMGLGIVILGTALITSARGK